MSPSASPHRLKSSKRCHLYGTHDFWWLTGTSLKPTLRTWGFLNNLALFLPLKPDGTSDLADWVLSCQIRDGRVCVAGLTDWEDDEILASVLAVSQQEYLDSMKHQSSSMHREREASPDSSWWLSPTQNTDLWSHLLALRRSAPPPPQTAHRDRAGKNQTSNCTLDIIFYPGVSTNEFS